MTICISMLLLLLPLGTFATPAMQPTSQRDFIYPKESYDECFLDEGQQFSGVCKKLQDCPTGLHRWQHENLTPKTCYFVKFDQYICCELDKSNLQATERPTLPTTTKGTFTFKAGDPRRPSEIGAELKAASLKAIIDSLCNYRGEEYNADAMTCNPYNAQFAVGGVPTLPNEFPYMAALGWRSNYDQKIVYRCGGVLISPRFVLTAAHCIDFGGDLPSTVLLGGNNLTLITNEQFKIRRVIVHPSYKGNTQYNDIALLELDITEEPKQQPACLWDGFDSLNTELIAVGYGQTQFAGKSSAQLLKVSLNWVSNEQCQPHYPQDILPLGVDSGQLCAGDPTRMRDTCQGDSGGPLILSQVFNYVVGITSLGQGCARGPPSIYTRVSHYLDWIEGIVWPTNS